jgi:phage recombination protein Bet
MSRAQQQVAQAAPPTDIARAPARASLVARFAAKYSVDPDKMLSTLKATAFKQPKGKDGSYPEVSNEQMLALLVIANEYNLNPFTREIYAFPDEKRGGIVPIVSVDGWIRIINERPELSSIEFDYQGFENVGADDKGDPYIVCTITRKDRTAPVVVREYMHECWRDTGPWNSHPRRMLRHKALVQCGRVAFGFAGIYDPDEADRIARESAIDVVATVVSGKPKTEAPRARQVEQQQPPPAPPTVAELRAAADKAGVGESELLERFEASGVDLNDFPPARIGEAIAWLNTLHAG